MIFGRMMMTMAKKIAIIIIQVVGTVYLRHDQEIGRFFLSSCSFSDFFWAELRQHTRFSSFFFLLRWTFFSMSSLSSIEQQFTVNELAVLI